ncbi:MAG: TMEM165/GDT1 family protein [Candidatus Eisenbacteria bacterium]
MLRAFFMSFGLIFLAELGDKTQLATLALAARTDVPGGRWLVFAGSGLALVATSALAVVAGSLLDRTVPPHVIRWVSGLLFLAAGLWTLLKG